jgi:hypothetical protein
MQTNSPISKKKRLMIAAALFALPLIAIAVAFFGLMNSHKKPVARTRSGSAFNTEVPDANLPKNEKNKLEIYMQAEQDSIKRSQERSKDPYGLNRPKEAALPAFTSPPGPSLPQQNPHIGVVTSPFQDDNDKKVTDRLQKLYAALSNSPASEVARPFGSNSPITPPVESAAAGKLEKLMETFHNDDTATSPQLRQVKDVLDEIREIQHPERRPTINGDLGNQVSALPVSALPANPADPEPAMTPVSSNGFFGLTEDADTTANSIPALQAVVHTSQTVQTGSIVKLRLLQPIYVGSRKIPANSFIYGPATIAGERVTIALTNAVCDGQVFPISLKVYDGADGLEGLYVPGLITRDVVKQNMSQGISGVSLGTLDPSLGAQAAAAAIETTRNLLSKKVSIIKATLKEGHLAILKDNTINH